MESQEGVHKEVSAFVISNGCHECFIDAALVQKYLREKHGFAAAENVAGADVIVLLGCAVMQPKEEQTRELIRTISEQKRPDSQLLICGCITKVRPELTELSNATNGLPDEIENLIALRGPNGDLKANFPYQPYRGHKKDLLGAVRARVRQRVLAEHTGGSRLKRYLVRRLSDPLIGLLSRYKDFVESKMDVWNTDTYTIKISTGCRGSCSYCSIKRSRGSISSKPISCVVEEFRTGLEKGYRSVALIGTDIGDYGKDRGEDLLDLLKVLTDVPGQFLLRLRNVNPRWIVRVGPQFHDLLRSGKIAYMEAPIQSASERILRLMNRGYTAEAFLAAMRDIRAVHPTLLVKTQIIVGFPGESQEDFQKSLDLFEEGLFDYIDVFRYSDRPNTRASELPEKVPGEIAMKRYRKLFFKSLFQLAPRTLILNHGRPSAHRECSDESLDESQ